MQNSGLYTIEFLGMNMHELAIYVGMTLAVMLIVLVIVKRR